MIFAKAKIILVDFVIVNMWARFIPHILISEVSICRIAVCLKNLKCRRRRQTGKQIQMPSPVLSVFENNRES